MTTGLFILGLLVRKTLPSPAKQKRNNNVSQSNPIQSNPKATSNPTHKNNGQSKHIRNILPQLPPHHLLRNHNLVVILPIVNRELQPDEVRQDRRCSLLRPNRWCTRWRGEFSRKRETVVLLSISFPSGIISSDTDVMLCYGMVWYGDLLDIRDDVRACCLLVISFEAGCSSNL